MRLVVATPITDSSPRGWAGEGGRQKEGGRRDFQQSRAQLRSAPPSPAGIYRQTDWASAEARLTAERPPCRSPKTKRKRRRRSTAVEGSPADDQRRRPTVGARVISRRKDDAPPLELADAPNDRAHTLHTNSDTGEGSTGTKTMRTPAEQVRRDGDAERN